MTQYILLIQGNTTSATSPEEWDSFFKVAKESGLFKGGSAIGEARIMIGDIQTARSTEQITGYMRFDADDREKLLLLLRQHPVVLHGGTVELCELPRS